MENRTWEEMYDILTNWICVSEETLDCCFAIMGCNTETAERILYYYTGWNNFDGFLEEMEEQFGD